MRAIGKESAVIGSAAMLVCALAFAVLAWFPRVAQAADLPDGSYTVDYQVMNATSSSQESMANKAMVKPLKVTVANGAYTATMGLQPLTLGSTTGYLKQLYYWSGRDYAEVSYADYYDAVDDFNKNAQGGAAYRYPKTVTFPLVNKQAGDSKGYVKIRVFVPLMDSITTGAGTKEALVKIDWSTAKVDAAGQARNELTAAVTQAKQVGNDDSTYTDESYRALQDAIEAADKALADTGSSADSLNKALASLNAATQGLVTRASVDQQAADAVAGQIRTLPSEDALTLNNRAAVDAAASAYDALTDAQKQRVPAAQVDALTKARQRMNQLVQQASQDERDSSAAASIAAQIDALPAYDQLTLNDCQAVQNARTAYDALTDGAKARVSADSLKRLTDAEAKLTSMRDAADSAKTTIEALPATNSLQLSDADAVRQARSAYDALDSTQKAYLGDAVKTTLQQTESQISALQQKAAQEEAERQAAKEKAVRDRADAVSTQISKLPDADEVTVKSESAITAARVAYEKLDADARAMVPKVTYDRLTSAEAALKSAKSAAAKKQTASKKKPFKKANPIRVKASKKSLAYRTLKKKFQKATLRVSKAKGKVTFAKAKKTGAYKKVSISKRGVVLFKKHAKKGSYLFKVKASGTGSYKAKTVTVKIKVK